jgi:hypothetical protein
MHEIIQLSKSLKGKLDNREREREKKKLQDVQRIKIISQITHRVIYMK